MKFSSASKNGMALLVTRIVGRQKERLLGASVAPKHADRAPALDWSKKRPFWEALRRGVRRLRYVEPAPYC